MSNHYIPAAASILAAAHHHPHQASSSLSSSSISSSSVASTTITAPVLVHAGSGNIVRTREWHQIKSFHQYLMVSGMIMMRMMMIIVQIDPFLDQPS